MRRALHSLTSSPKRLMVAGVLAALVLGGGSASAYYTTSASGTGSGQVGSVSQPVTITPAAPTGALGPGGSADLAATVDNPNSVPVHLSSLVLDTSRGTGGFAVDATHAANGCTVAAAGLSFTAQSNGGSGFDVPAKVGSTDGTLSLDLANAVSLGSAAANACQGATFTIYLKVGS